jgi:DNA-binding PadR family transcriptional regulator
MARRKTAPTAADYAVLALLSEEQAHGYVVAQHFEPGGDLSLLYSMDQSSVYDLLRELRQESLIASRREVAGARPPRNVFVITDEGEAHLTAWLTEPVEPDHRLRLDFLLKLHFIARKSPTDAASLIAQQLLVGERYVDDLDVQLAALRPDSLDALVVESKRAALHGFIIWLRAKGEGLQAAVVRTELEPPDAQG